MAWESIMIGAAHQFGTLLQPSTERVSCGIGFALAPQTKRKEIVKPTHTFDEEAEFEIAGC